MSVLIGVPGTVARAGWEIDIKALADARREHGIVLPILVRYTDGRYTYGCHRANAKGHRISLSQDKPADSANETLWHELCHAIQSEAWARESELPIGRFYREGYKPMRGPHGASYMENMYEVEARMFADRQAGIRLVTLAG